MQLLKGASAGTKSFREKKRIKDERIKNFVRLIVLHSFVLHFSSFFLDLVFFTCVCFDHDFASRNLGSLEKNYKSGMLCRFKHIADNNASILASA